jgi:hypothetical protein
MLSLHKTIGPVFFETTDTIILILMALLRELTEEKCRTDILYARTARWFKREIANFSRQELCCLSINIFGSLLRNWRTGLGAFL